LLLPPTEPGFAYLQSSLSARPLRNVK
jgi:hypothetical protein